MGKPRAPAPRSQLSAEGIRALSAGPRKEDWREAIRSEFQSAARLCVLGVGNRDRADDGAGVLCAEILQDLLGRARAQSQQSAFKQTPLRPIRVLEAGEVPENATGLIRRFQPTHVLIVDAAFGGRRPGEIFPVDRRKIRQEDISTHRIPLVHLMRYLEQSIGCRVALVGIEPGRVAWNEPMSPAVRKAAAKLARGIFLLWKKTAPQGSSRREPRKNRAVPGAG